MVIKKYGYLAPLIVLIITVGYLFYVIATTDIIFGDKHYLGLAFLALSIIGSFIRKDLGIYFTGVTLLIGTLNVIAFTPAIEAYSFGFGVNDKSRIDFKIQLYSFLVLVLYLALNLRYVINQIATSTKADK